MSRSNWNSSSDAAPPSAPASSSGAKVGGGRDLHGQIDAVEQRENPFAAQQGLDPRALIPRHETEELIELIVERLETPPARILDLGTGNGAIALALASKYSDAKVTATDQSEEAITLAKENANALNLSSRVTFMKGNWFEPLDEGARFDLIVSNPPYLTEAEMQTAEPEVIDHEPRGALASGQEGLDDLSLLLKSVPKHLAEGGLLALETGIGQAEVIKEMALEVSLYGQSVEDLSKRPRFFFAS